MEILGGNMKDKDKLVVIAQTYSFIKGEFTANQLHDFIQANNFKFHSGFTPKMIGRFLSRNDKFEKNEAFTSKYRAI